MTSVIDRPMLMKFWNGKQSCMRWLTHRLSPSLKTAAFRSVWMMRHLRFAMARDELCQHIDDNDAEFDAAINVYGNVLCDNDCESESERENNWKKIKAFFPFYNNLLLVAIRIIIIKQPTFFHQSTLTIAHQIVQIESIAKRLLIYIRII